MEYVQPQSKQEKYDFAEIEACSFVRAYTKQHLEMCSLLWSLNPDHVAENPLPCTGVIKEVFEVDVGVLVQGSCF